MTDEELLEKELLDMTPAEQDEWKAVGATQRDTIRRFANGEVVRALPTPEAKDAL